MMTFCVEESLVTNCQLLSPRPVENWKPICVPVGLSSLTMVAISWSAMPVKSVMLVFSTTPMRALKKNPLLPEPEPRRNATFAELVPKIPPKNRHDYQWNDVEPMGKEIW